MISFYLIMQSRAFHRRASRWAVTDAAPAAAAVIYAAPELPPADTPVHAEAAQAAPRARFAYADADPRITEISRSVLREPAG